MLDANLKTQLKEAFSVLEKRVQLCVHPSDHAKQNELMELLEGVAETSEKIDLKKASEPKPFPSFDLSYDGQETGVTFDGIPAGHEFTSLILAILHADGKGKLPDEGILHRIRSLKGPIDLRTYISLSCENCPTVVQALNLVALLHPEAKHRMIDGEFVPEDIEHLGISGVPAVFSQETRLHSGQTTLGELLEKLEAAFGMSQEASTEPKDLGLFDVVVLGAGPAGASAAIYAARKGLKTLVLGERVGGQLQDTKGIENLISVPYTEGPALSAQLAKHMAEYDLEPLEHRKVTGIRDQEDGLKHVTLNSGETLTAKAVIVSTGAKWRELGVPGEAEYLGSGVAYCPHCDGPFYKGKPVAVVGGGNSGVEAAIDLAGITSHVTVVEFADALKADQVLIDKLKSLPNADIIVNAKSTEVLGDGSKATGLQYEDRSTGESHTLDVDGIFVQIGLVPNSQFLEGVLDRTPWGEIIIDEKNRTSVKGIYAAGDVTTVPYKQIIVSMGEGAKAGLAAFEDQMV